MALVLQDRVQEIATANTTVSFTLIGAVTGFQSFSAIGDTNTTYYAATDTYGNWEAGIGTYSTTGPTLTRTTILSSSNSGAAVTFSSESGAVNIFCTYPSERALYIDAAGTTFDAPNSVITSSSSADALRITQTGSGNALVVEDSANPDSTPFIIDTNGNIASGLLSTTSAMEIYRTSNATFRIDGDGTSSTVQARSFSNLSGTATIANFARARGTRASSTIVQSGDLLSQYRGSGYDGAAFIQAGNIEFYVDGTPGVNDMPGRLVFNTTADGAATPTERMRIDSAGAVGIGSTSLTGYNLRVNKNLTGATTSIGVDVSPIIQSDVTVTGTGFRTQLTTAAASFTLGNITHYNATQLTLGAGSTVNNQYGYVAGSSLTGATNDYGFFGNIAAGTNLWNLYMQGTANNYLAGRLGIGSTSLTDRVLAVVANITGATTAFGVATNSTIQSDVTVSARIFQSSPNTQAASFTLGALTHYYANQATIGAGSAVNNQYGFLAESSLTGATNNYGFLGNIAAGTNLWNLYMQGTASNYMAGSLGIGNATLTARDIRITRTLTGSTTAYSIYTTSTAASDVTSSCFGIVSQIGTAAASFTIPTLYQFASTQGTFGAGSVVTSQYGYIATSALVGATNNYGFYGDIAAPTSGITTTGTISSISSTGTTVTVNHNAITYTAGQTVTVTATANATALVSGATCTILTLGTTSQTDWNTLAGTSGVTYAVGSIFTAAVAGSGITGSGTVTLNIQGSGKTVNAGAASGSFQFTAGTSQTFTAVTVTGSVTVSTRYNLYMASTANNYMAGSLGIGSTSLTNSNLNIAKTITGGTAATGISITSVVQSDVTSDARYYRTSVSTAASAFTLPTLNHFYAAQGTFGIGSVVTNQFGFQNEVNLTGATNNYGFYGSIPAPTSGIATTGTISSISSSGTTVTVNHNAITYTNGQTVTVTATANATALVSGATCTILTVGTTDFTAIGAASNTVGVSFTATGAGTGTGTVTLNVQGSGKTVAGAASGSFTFTTTTSQTFAAVTVTGSVTVSTRYNLYMSGTAPNYFGGDMQFNKTVTATGTTGAQTINKNAGTVNFAAAAASVVVTNSLVTVNSIIICTVGTNDTTMKSVQAVAAAGSFTLYPSAAPTAETRVNFIVIN